MDSAEQGNELAQAQLGAAVADLVESVLTVQSKLGLQQAFPVVLAGGPVHDQAAVLDLLRAHAVVLGYCQKLKALQAACCAQTSTTQSSAGMPWRPLCRPKPRWCSHR